MMYEKGNGLEKPSAIALKGMTRWIFNENTNQIISKENIQCLAARQLPSGYGFSVEFEDCV